MLNHLKSVISFFLHPVEELEEVHNLTSKLKWFFGLIILNIVIATIAGFIQKLPVKFGFVDTGQHSVVKLLTNGNIYISILIIGIVAPIVEELMFRLPLRIKKYNFIPLIVFGILLNGIGIVYQQLKLSIWYLMIPVSITIIALIVNFTPSYFNKITGFLKSKYSWYFYSITVLFALMHIFNYQFSWQLLLFMPILVLPQLVAGLFVGYIRIKLGLHWGMVFHSVHNLLFLLPFYIVMNSANHNHISISQINKDGYTIEIAEEGDSIFYYGSKITPNEIILNGTMKEVISKLRGIRKDDVKFENVLLSEKKIGIRFKNDSAYNSPSTGIARQLALNFILEKYNLKIESEKRWAGIYKLNVSDHNKFELYLAKSDTVKHSKNIRRFYGENDTIKFVDTNSNYLRGALELNFEVFVENEIDEKLIFSVNIPNGKLNQTAKYLYENYGIGLEREQSKRDFLIVKSK